MPSRNGSARTFGLTAAARVGGLPPLQVAPRRQSNQPVQPLPRPRGAPPFRLRLADVLPAEQIAEIESAGVISFHVTGDTGGVKSPASQELVASKMTDDAAAGHSPARFLYLLGDVVYYYGEAADYYSQFYEPYLHYPAPIFAIPGNHDGDVFGAHTRSLAPFVDNFCAGRAHLTREAGDTPRDAMTQPNVYWTLEAPLVTIVGLYTNVPEGGVVEADQQAWLAGELAAAAAGSAVVLAMHHPAFSWDRCHHGSLAMLEVIDAASAQAGRAPDLVLAGHVHNYQRFTRSSEPGGAYIVAGAGGYWNLHTLPRPGGTPLQVPFQPPGEAAVLEAYVDDRHGFLRLDVTGQKLAGTYFTVPRPHESWSAPAGTADVFEVPLRAAERSVVTRT